MDNCQVFLLLFTQFLGVLTLHQSGTREMFIYSPYWLINKTGLHVEYRVSKHKLKARKNLFTVRVLTEKARFWSFHQIQSIWVLLSFVSYKYRTSVDQNALVCGLY